MAKKLNPQHLSEINKAVQEMDNNGFSEEEIQAFADDYTNKFGVDTDVKKKVSPTPQNNIPDALKPNKPSYTAEDNWSKPKAELKAPKAEQAEQAEQAPIPDALKPNNTDYLSQPIQQAPIQNQEAEETQPLPQFTTMDKLPEQQAPQSQANNNIDINSLNTPQITPQTDATSVSMPNAEILENAKEKMAKKKPVDDPIAYIMQSTAPFGGLGNTINADVNIPILHTVANFTDNLVNAYKNVLKGGSELNKTTPTNEQAPNGSDAKSVLERALHTMGNLIGSTEDAFTSPIATATDISPISTATDIYSKIINYLLPLEEKNKLIENLSAISNGIQGGMNHLTNYQALNTTNSTSENVVRSIAGMTPELVAAALTEGASIEAGAGAVATEAGGSILSKKGMSLLEKYVPKAVPLVEKYAPKVTNFVKKGASNGFTKVLSVEGAVGGMANTKEDENVYVNGLKGAVKGKLEGMYMYGLGEAAGVLAKPIAKQLVDAGANSAIANQIATPLANAGVFVGAKALRTGVTEGRLITPEEAAQEAGTGIGLSLAHLGMIGKNHNEIDYYADNLLKNDVLNSFGRVINETKDNLEKAFNVKLSDSDIKNLEASRDEIKAKILQESDLEVKKALLSEAINIQNTLDAHSVISDIVSNKKAIQELIPDLPLNKEQKEFYASKVEAIAQNFDMSEDAVKRRDIQNRIDQANIGKVKSIYDGNDDEISKYNEELQNLNKERLELTTPKIETDAIQKQGTDESVLRTEQQLKPKNDGGNDGGISKASVKNDYGFTKNFEQQSDKDLSNKIISELERRGKLAGRTAEQQAAFEVGNMFIPDGHASSHDIITTAFHLRNLDAQIEKSNNLGENTDHLLSQRQKALDVLAELGHNSGSNLRLFSLAYKITQEGRLDIIKAELKRDLKIDNIPSTIAELKASNLSAEDKIKIEPYVREIESIKVELSKIKTEAENNTKSAIEEALKEQVATLKIENEKGKTTTKVKDVKSIKNKLKDIADKLEKEDDDEYKVEFFSKVSDAVRYMADNIEDADIPKLVKETAEKFSDKENPKEDLETKLKDVLKDNGIDSEEDTRTEKEKALGDIKDYAEIENADTITKDMVEKGFIKKVFNGFVKDNVPYDELIKKTTDALKEHLPNVTENEVTDAILRKGDFKPDIKPKSALQTALEDVRRLKGLEAKIKALQGAKDISDIQNDNSLTLKQKKDAIQKRKVAYEKGLDKIVEDREREKKDAIKSIQQNKIDNKKLETERNRQLKKVEELTKKRDDLLNRIRNIKSKTNPIPDTPEIENLKSQVKDADKKLRDIENDIKDKQRKEDAKQKRLNEIDAEINHVKTEKKVFNKSIKNPKAIDRDIKNAQDILKNEYNKAGVRREAGSKTEIKIAQDAQNAIDEINKSDLPDDIKKQHIDAINEQTKKQINNTKQGVLTNLKNSIDNHIDELTEKAKELQKNKLDTKEILELKDKLSKLSNSLRPDAENLQDQINKADFTLDGIVKNYNGTEYADDLSDIQKEYLKDWQRTSNELQAKELIDKAKRSVKEAERKIAGEQFTEIPTTKLNVKLDAILDKEEAQKKIAWAKLSAMAKNAKEQRTNKSIISKALELRRDLMVASFSAVEKVASSGITKPIFDPLIKQSFGRIASLITGIRATEINRLGDTFRQLKNQKSVDKLVEKMNDRYVEAIKNYDKSKGTENEAKALVALKKAELDHESLMPYLFINAGSHIDISQIMTKGSTDFDQKMGKYTQTSPEDRGVRFWLESVNRTHAAIKSISHRQALLNSYIQNLQHFQDANGFITPESRKAAWDTAVIIAEEGRFGEKTLLSDWIGKKKSSDNALIRNSANYLFPVAKIGINITKQGLDMALPFELLYRTHEIAKKGMADNELANKEYSNAFKRYREGLKTGFDQLPLEQKLRINTLITRGLMGAAQYALVGYLLANDKIKYGGSYDENDPYRKNKVIGSDGLPLDYGEWEIMGHRTPKLLSTAINHSPYFLPASLAVIASQQNKFKKGENPLLKKIAKVTNEIYERMPIKNAIGVAQVLMSGDEYKLEHIIANEFPTMKNVAEYYDKDNEGNTIKRKVDSGSFFGTVWNIIKSNSPGLRESLPVKSSNNDEKLAKIAQKEHTLLIGYKDKAEMMTGNPTLYEKNFGKNSEYYKTITKEVESNISERKKEEKHLLDKYKTQAEMEENNPNLYEDRFGKESEFYNKYNNEIKFERKLVKDATKNLLGKYKTKTDLKRYNPDLYEDRFGDDSNYEDTYGDIIEENKEERAEKRQARDAKYNYLPKKKKNKW